MGKSSKTEFVNTNPHVVPVDNPDFGQKDEQPSHVMLDAGDTIKADGRIAELIDQVPGVVDVKSDQGKAFLSKEERDNRGVLRASHTPGPKAFPAADGGEIVTLPAPRGSKPKNAKKASGKAPASKDKRTVAQLRREAKKKGITVTASKGNKPTKADYVNALAGEGGEAQGGTVTTDKVPSSS